MQSKFWKLYREFITEQQDSEQPQAVTDIENGIQPPEADIPATDEQPDITEQEPGEQLDTSGFVTMVRLLKDAFVVRPEEEDAGSIMDIGEINGTNAYKKFKQILSLIKKYNPEIDVDISLNNIPQ